MVPQLQLHSDQLPRDQKAVFHFGIDSRRLAHTVGERHRFGKSENGPMAVSLIDQVRDCFLG